ncbi:TPA: porin [Enterobacter hormaechei subsp. xiangfangensis]|nr:porin [Enterobacter hormaechei subsp. xiangfangensis]
MMKSKLALIIGALALSTSAVNAAEVYKDSSTDIDVYGFVSGAHKFVEHGKNNGFDASEAQLGVKAKEQLNDQFALIGQYEGRVKSAEHGKRHRLLNRQAWAGIDAADYGQLTIGRQNGVIYDIAGLSDQSVNFSGMGVGLDEGLFGRADGIIQYANTFDFVKVISQYKLSQTSDSFETGLPVNEGHSYGIGALLTDVAGTGLGGGLAYAHGEKGDSSKPNAAKRSDTYTAALTYVKDSVYAAATSTFGHNVRGAKSFYDDEVYASYAFDNGIAPAINYTSTNCDGKHSEYVEPDLVYSFNKNVSTGVGYAISVNGGNNVAKTYLKYQF